VIADCLSASSSLKGVSYFFAQKLSLVFLLYMYILLRTNVSYIFNFTFSQMAPWLITFLIILINGFFVAAEFALVKVRASQIDVLIKQGNSKAILIKHIIDHLDNYLSACQLGITIASLAL
jgi:hypothetical protein